MKYETIKCLWLFVFITSIIASLQIRFPFGLSVVALILIISYFFQPSDIYKYLNKESAK